MPTPDVCAVYQLRIRLDRISPLIWRRLLVTDAMTIADLHCFVIHGKSYGIAYPGGMCFADDPDQVHLSYLHVRPGERFWYEYNFHVPWRHEIRVEQIGASASGQRYPVCIGGARAAPPEECGDPHDFLALRQHYHSLYLIERLLALLDDPDAYDDPYDELRILQYWAAVNRCDRRAINRQLRQTHAEVH